MGEIEDEFDIAPPDQSMMNGNDLLILDGSVNIRDLDSQYDLLIPRDRGFETLAGFVLAQLQRIPRTGEAFDYEGHRFVIEEMDGHRIARVRIENQQAKAVSQPGG